MATRKSCEPASSFYGPHFFTPQTLPQIPPTKNPTPVRCQQDGNIASRKKHQATTGASKTIQPTRNFVIVRHPTLAVRLPQATLSRFRTSSASTVPRNSKSSSTLSTVSTKRSTPSLSDFGSLKPPFTSHPSSCKSRAKPFFIFRKLAQFSDLALFVPVGTTEVQKWHERKKKHLKKEIRHKRRRSIARACFRRRRESVG